MKWHETDSITDSIRLQMATRMLSAALTVEYMDTKNVSGKESRASPGIIWRDRSQGAFSAKDRRTTGIERAESRDYGEVILLL